MENTKKKVNKKPMLIAGIAMLLALVGCVGGLTYSKYVSSKSIPSTQATVAKWGYVITANSTNLFGTKYVKGDADNTAKVASEGTGVIVSASTNNVIAPGATGSLTLSVKGTAEVAAKLNIALAVTSDITLKDGTEESANVYSPVKWTLTNNGTAIVSDVTLAEVAKKINQTDVTIDANATSIDYDYELTYSWPFDGSKTNTDLKANASDTTGITADTADTILGLKAAGTTLTDTDYAYAQDWDASTTLSLSLTASVEQVIA